MDDSSTKHAAGRLNIKDMISCPICFEHFNAPRSLPCLHTFCLDCIQNFSIGCPEGAVLACPMCRQDWKIPAGGCKNLPTNNYVLTMQEAHMEECARQRCTKHVVEELRLFCEECDVPICILCISESHCGHELVPIPVHEERKKELEEELESKLIGFNLRLIKYRDILTKVVQAELVSKQTMVKLQLEVSARCKTLVDSIEGKCQDFLDEITLRGQHNADIFSEMMRECSTSIDYVEKLSSASKKNDGSGVDLLSGIRRKLSDMQALERLETRILALEKTIKVMVFTVADDGPSIAEFIGSLKAVRPTDLLQLRDLEIFDSESDEKLEEYQNQNDESIMPSTSGTTKPKRVLCNAASSRAKSNCSQKARKRKAKQKTQTPTRHVAARILDDDTDSSDETSAATTDDIKSNTSNSCISVSRSTSSSTSEIDANGDDSNNGTGSHVSFDKYSPSSSWESSDSNVYVPPRKISRLTASAVKPFVRS